MSLLAVIPTVSGETNEPVETAGEARQETQRASVFFITNRGRQPAKNDIDTYGGERGEIAYGRCHVKFSTIPMMGELASRLNFYIPTESRELGVEQISGSESFWRQVEGTSGETTTGSVVLFVHGYNYGFERNCRMAAEMQRGLAGKATVIAFSWPSNAQPADYVSDQADLEWSVPLLTETIAHLGQMFGATRVQLVAHSLGSRGVLFSLERLAAQTDQRPLVGRLVLLAPDYDAQTFAERLPDLSPLVAGLTLYASSEDAPLQVSERLSGYPRLGQAGESLTVMSGMETIDVSLAGRYQILGHEYYYYHPSVAADLIELLTTGTGASGRNGLVPRTRNSETYWEIPPLAQ